MAEQGAVGLAHLAAALFALGIVGFGDIDGDQAVVVAGQHLGDRAVGIGHIGQEIEGQSEFRVFRPALQRQAQAEHGVEQVVLGNFQLAPSRHVLGIGQVGDGAVMPAGRAMGLGRIGRQQPVAGVKLGIGAEPISLAGIGQRLPGVAFRLQGR
jgi:hypothetical protein